MSWLYHPNISFNRQLSTTFVLGILILSVISSSLISFVVNQTAENRFVSEGKQVTNGFAAQSRLALLYGSEENAQLPAKTLLGFPDVAQVSIYYPDKKLLMTEGEPSEDDLGDWIAGLTSEARLVHESRQSWYFGAEVIPSFADDLMDPVFGEVEPDSQTLGFVLVAVSKRGLHAMTQKILVINALIAISLASVLLIILRYITKRLTTPLENLSGIMQRAERGETKIRAELEGPKDIVHMEHAFNSMMTVLEQRESELKDARDAALETAGLKPNSRLL